MKLLYGKPVAEEILAHLKNDISLSSEKPGLAVILVGNDDASQIYVNLKEKRAKEIGMNFFRFDFDKNISQAEILKQIENLNDDEKVNGIIVQLPLPEGFDQQKIIESIDPKKDADGFHPANTDIFLQGRNEIVPVFPQAIMNLIVSSGEDLENKKAIVIANSDDFGKIMSAMLEKEKINSEYVLSVSILSNIGKIANADIIVSAVGSPGLLNGQMLKDGSIVIDGGIEKVGNDIFGDVDFGSTVSLNGYITPVPGGVGPVTIACLLRNVFLAFEAQQKEK